MKPSDQQLEAMLRDHFAQEVAAAKADHDGVARQRPTRWGFSAVAAALLVVSLPVLLWVSGSRPSALETEIARGWVRIDAPARYEQMVGRLTEQLQTFGGRPQRDSQRN